MSGRLHKSILIILAICTLLLSVFFPLMAFASESTAFDKVDVMDDLNSSKDFNVLKYPFKENELAKIMNVVEYCYSPYSDQRDNYGLYIYVYNPSSKEIATADERNTVQIKIGEQNGIATYEKFKLKYLSKSTGNIANRFYKFKIVNSQKLLKTVLSDKRIYEISGFELVYIGAQLPKDNTTGGKYEFTGFAKGYGYDSDADSTLNSNVVETEVIQIRDLTFTADIADKNNANGVGHYNMTNSVFFTMPSYFEKTYGNLQKIYFEFYEYKTSPILVTSNTDLATKAMASRGKRVEPFTNTADIPFQLYYGETLGGTPTLPRTNYDWTFNLNKSNNPNNIEGYSKSSSAQLPLVFERKSIGSRTFDISTQAMLDYIYIYDSSNYNGYLQHRNITRDLFMGTVDKGRTEGYNNKWIDASEVINLLEYDFENGWNEFWYKLFGIKPDEVPRSFKPIQRIENLDDIDGLNIGENEKYSFKDMFNKLPNNSYMYLFTFAITDYFSAWCDNYRNSAYIAETTAFLDFDLIAFTFAKNGKYTTIPVVSDPIDAVSGTWSPPIDKGMPDWLKWLIAIFLLVILLVVLLPFLPTIISFVIRVVVMVITLPFKLIGAIFKKKKN